MIMDTNNDTKKRGFANLDKDTLKLIAQRGGVAAHFVGSAHEFSREEARVAGSKGGLATAAKKREAKEKNGGLGGSTETI